jgi:hypothetical protein
MQLDTGHQATKEARLQHFTLCPSVVMGELDGPLPDSPKQGREAEKVTWVRFWEWAAPTVTATDLSFCVSCIMLHIA